MRNFILPVVWLMITIQLFAQADYRDPFMGTWVWYNNTDTFRMKFKKAIFYIDEKTRRLGLYGYHEYKTGNKVLESSLQNYDIDKEIKLSTIRTWWSPNWDEPNNIVRGYIKDVEYRDYERDLELTLLPDKKTMRFEARNGQHVIIVIDGVPSTRIPENRTFYFPKSMVLTKEE